MLPLLPLLNIYTGLYLTSTALDQFRWLESKKFLATTNLEEFFRLSSKRAKALFGLLFVTNLPVVLYTGLLHQRGCLDVPKHVYDIGSNAQLKNTTFWFLTPCFSVPLYSHVHLNMQIRFLTCEPNLNLTKDYTDEADVFYSNPEKWLKEEFEKLNLDSTPTHILTYDSLWLKIKSFFELHGYKKCEMIYNTDFPQSQRQSKYFVILCKKKK